MPQVETILNEEGKRPLKPQQRPSGSRVKMRPLKGGDLDLSQTKLSIKQLLSSEIIMPLIISQLGPSPHSFAQESSTQEQRKAVIKDTAVDKTSVEVSESDLDWLFGLIVPHSLGHKSSSLAQVSSSTKACGTPPPNIQQVPSGARIGDKSSLPKNSPQIYATISQSDPSRCAYP